jgi:hypothetical protein
MTGNDESPDSTARAKIWYWLRQYCRDVVDVWTRIDVWLALIVVGTMAYITAGMWTWSVAIYLIFASPSVIFFTAAVLRLIGWIEDVN